MFITFDIYLEANPNGRLYDPETFSCLKPASILNCVNEINDF